MPAAWEILTTRKNRVLVAVISPPELKVSFTWMEAFGAMQLPPQSNRFYPRGLPYDAARNMAVKTCIDSGYGWLYFQDSDVIAPADIVTRLLEAKRDLIGALYHQRFPPYKPAAFMRGASPEGPVMAPLPGHSPGDILPVDFLPSGATLISRRCLESMIAKYPRPFLWGVDIAPVLGDDGQPVPRFSEDFTFSYRAKGLGFQPWLHTGIRCRHEMAMVSTERGAEPLE